MPQSLASVHLHAVFSTLDRRPFLNDDQTRYDLHAYIGGVTKSLKCPPIAVGGVTDHVHLLARLDRSISIADWMKEVKRISSVQAKLRNPEFAWQAGYGVFAVEEDNLDKIATYVRNQEEHHKSVSFKDEFRKLLREHNIEWDERYLWD